VTQINIAIQRFLGAIGHLAFDFLAQIGRIALFGMSALRHMVTGPFYPREFFTHL